MCHWFVFWYLIIWLHAIFFIEISLLKIGEKWLDMIFIFNHFLHHFDVCICVYVWLNVCVERGYSLGAKSEGSWVSQYRAALFFCTPEHLKTNSVILSSRIGLLKIYPLSPRSFLADKYKKYYETIQPSEIQVYSWIWDADMYVLTYTWQTNYFDFFCRQLDFLFEPGVANEIVENDNTFFWLHLWTGKPLGIPTENGWNIFFSGRRIYNRISNVRWTNLKYLMSSIWIRQMYVNNFFLLFLLAGTRRICRYEEGEAKRWQNDYQSVAWRASWTIGHQFGWRRRWN